ncbi:MAG: hypothetical protein MRJ96_06025 [Nitrospirales bacterium]|nr:hypothetical protein [Nitrospira sp.]MDR4500992.1 hypothetical protein [Nitrospirales bacterium]
MIPRIQAKLAIVFVAFTLTALLTACVITDHQLREYRAAEEARLEESQRRGGKGYQPVEPIPIRVATGQEYNSKEENISNQRLLRALPNESMRLAIGQLHQGGGISYGPFALALKNKNYMVILDYIKYYTKSMRVIATSEDPSFRKFAIMEEDQELPEGVTAMAIPIYLGVGLRLQAAVTVLESGVNLGSLYGLGLAAQQERIVGTLHIQTLGISGESISPLLPMPSEINVSTIQAAIQALATIKSKLYDPSTIQRQDNKKSSTNLRAERVTIVPAIVGLEDYFGEEGSKEQFISNLLKEPIQLDISQFERTLD